MDIGVNIDNTVVAAPGCADDLALVAENEEDLNLLLDVQNLYTSEIRQVRERFTYTV